MGENEDICRWTYNRPAQDRPGVLTARQFGSSHPGGWNVALCDGSARTVSYTIDPRVHLCLGNRKDGEAIGGEF